MNFICERNSSLLTCLIKYLLREKIDVNVTLKQCRIWSIAYNKQRILKYLVHAIFFNMHKAFITYNN